MEACTDANQKLEKEGFAIINNVFTESEIKAILSTISSSDTSKPTFRKTAELFAIRQFFKEVPAAFEKVFTNKFRQFILTLFGTEFFIVKSIYFDKPETSNWFVAYHQDLTISVDKKIDVEGFGPWTTKLSQFAVQPPLNILKDNITVRIHLDDTNEKNGALKVIPASHLNGICKAEIIKSLIEKETICNVEKGGIMLMKPLLLHASARTTNGQKRRVIHIEFSRTSLPRPLQWSEKMQL